MAEEGGSGRMIAIVVVVLVLVCGGCSCLGVAGALAPTLMTMMGTM
jgi:hypothetical protein